MSTTVYFGELDYKVILDGYEIGEGVIDVIIGDKKRLCLEYSYGDGEIVTIPFTSIYDFKREYFGYGEDAPEYMVITVKFSERVGDTELYHTLEAISV